MRVLGSAIGAILAAMLEASVVSNLALDGPKPDLVFALGVAVVAVLGFEAGMAWAMTGGIMLDILLPERSLGATSLALLLMTAAAVVVARLAWPPRLPVVAIVTFGLAIGFQVLTLVLLSLTSGVALGSLSISTLAAVALLDALVAVGGVVVLRALELRFGDMERAGW